MIAYQMYQIIPNHLGMTAIERYAIGLMHNKHFYVKL